jgi:hypothetical protein
MLRHVVLSTIAIIALGAATVSTPALARGGGGGHMGGFGGGHAGGFGGGHFGAGGMAHFGGGAGRAAGFVGGNFAGPRVGGMRPLASGAGRTHVSGLHHHFRHGRGLGFVDGSSGFDACDWPWRAQWLYCGD